MTQRRFNVECQREIAAHTNIFECPEIRDRPTIPNAGEAWPDNVSYAGQHTTSVGLVPTNARRRTGLMLKHRLRRLANIKPALVQRLVFTGVPYLSWADDSRG